MVNHSVIIWVINPYELSLGVTKGTGLGFAQELKHLF